MSEPAQVIARPPLTHRTPVTMQLHGIRRKLVHATLFEAIAIACVTVAVRLFSPGTDTAEASTLAVATSVVAWLWNLVFNSAFEAWERRQPSLTRTTRRRLAHAVGFEGGLVLVTVPLIAWWLQVGWWAALVADLGLVAFFLVYTFAYNWGFDRAFGSPHAQHPPQHSN